jgi:ATP-binding protein involved in chromosome partitioning
MPIPLKPAEVSGQPPVEPDEVRKLTASADAAARRKQNLGGVKKIIGIHSGKGGVGKTFVTVNIAYALADRGHSVGIIDGDVDCPNIPAFLKAGYTLYVDEHKRFKPVTHRGVKIISMGFTKEDATEPFLLRGPAKHRVAIDFLTNTNWGDLDVLIIDLPPGTSDVPMSYLEFGELSGIVYVTTPQKEAVIDTKKSISMGKTFAMHPIGLIENMSGGVFGAGKGQLLAFETGIPFLGSIPLSEAIFEKNEAGEIAFLDEKLAAVVAPILDGIEKLQNQKK